MQLYEACHGDLVTGYAPRVKPADVDRTSFGFLLPTFWFVFPGSALYNLSLSEMRSGHEGVTCSLTVQFSYLLLQSLVVSYCTMTRKLSKYQVESGVVKQPSCWSHEDPKSEYILLMVVTSNCREASLLFLIDITMSEKSISICSLSNLQGTGRHGP